MSSSRPAAAASHDAQKRASVLSELAAKRERAEAKRLEALRQQLALELLPGECWSTLGGCTCLKHQAEGGLAFALVQR